MSAVQIRPWAHSPLFPINSLTRLDFNSQEIGTGYTLKPQRIGLTYLLKSPPPVTNRAMQKKGRAKSSKKTAKALRSEDFQRAIKTIIEKESTKPLSIELAEAGIPSPIILIGNQHIRARRIIDWIRERFFAVNDSETMAYFGSELSTKKSLEPINQSLMSQSLFAKQTLLTIYDSDSTKGSIAKDLAALLQKGDDSNVIIITAEDATKKTSVAGLLGDKATRIELSELQGTQLFRWIEKEARQLGASGFEKGAAQLLVKYFGSDTTLLVREIEKLALLTEPDTAISSKLVHQLSFQNPDVTSFELVQKIARRDVAAASTQALSLVDQGMHPMQISYFLSRCIRTLLARNNTSAKEQLASEFTNYWFTKNLSGLERSFPDQNTNECLEALRSLDFNLKDSTFNDRMALSIAVQKLASRTQHQKRMR